MRSISKRVRPMRAYAAPKYPTGAEIGDVDISRVPARWQGLKAVVSTLGAAAMSLKALALEAQEAVKPVAAAPVVSVPDAEKAAAKAAEKDEAKTPATETCPLPAEEIAGDGAGAFGCVAMDPPVILPEGEALDIIEKEFAKRGIKLVDCPVVEGVELPQKDWARKLSPKERRKLGERVSCEGMLPEIPRERRRLMLDFGSADGAIAVEYVSRDDQNDWIYNPWRYSTLGGVLTRMAAEETVRCLRTRTEGKPLKVGVFYDPCADVPKDWKPTYPDGMKRDDPGAWWIEFRQREAAGRAEARKLLLAQIESFFEFLAKHPAK